MDKLRICIGSDDGIGIARTHMGDTKRFFVFDVYEHNDPVFVEERPNTAIDMTHSTSDKRMSVMRILEDVDVFVAARMSPNFKKIAANTRHQPVVVSALAIKDSLSLVQQSFALIHELVIERKDGKRIEHIPELVPDSDAAKS